MAILVHQIGSSSSATVRGLTTGSTTLTITMTTGGQNYTDTVAVDVIAGRPNIIRMADNANVPSEGEGDIQGFHDPYHSHQVHG